MTFDLRPRMPERPTEGQIYEGGVNSHANCVPAEHLAVLMDLGYPDKLEPQDVTNAIFPPDGIAKGGMAFEDVVTFLQQSSQYFNLPKITVIRPSDILAALDLYGKAGFPVIIAICVDGPTVLPYPCSGHTFGHSMSVVAHLPNDNWILRNPWTGLYNVLTTSDYLLACYQGGITLFEKSVMEIPAIPNPIGGGNSMLLLTSKVLPGESVFAVGVYSGTLPDGNWTTYFDLYADSVFGASPVTFQLYYIPDSGNAALQLPIYTVSPSIGRPSVNLATLIGVGGGTLEFRNVGTTPGFVTVKREFWRAGW